MSLGRTLAALAISIMGFANEALAFAPGVVDTPHAAIKAISVAVTNPTSGAGATMVLSDWIPQPDGGYPSMVLGNGVTEYRDVDGLSRTESIYTTGANIQKSDKVP